MFHSFHVELGAFNVYCKASQKAREDFELGNHHDVSLQGCTGVLFTGLVYSHWIVKFCLPFWDSGFPEVRFEWKTSSKISCHIFHYLPPCFEHHRSMVAFRFSSEEMSVNSAGRLFCFLVCTIFYLFYLGELSNCTSFSPLRRIFPVFSTSSVLRSENHYLHMPNRTLGVAAMKGAFAAWTKGGRPRSGSNSNGLALRVSCFFLLMECFGRNDEM